jgi:hypothetical protein
VIFTFTQKLLGKSCLFLIWKYLMRHILILLIRNCRLIL